MSMEMRLKARGSTEKEANTKLHKQATAIMRKKGYRDYYTTDPAWEADEMFGGGEKSARVVFTDKGDLNMQKKVKDAANLEGLKKEIKTLLKFEPAMTLYHRRNALAFKYGMTPGDVETWINIINKEIKKSLPTKDMDDFKRAVIQAAVLKAKGIGPKAIAVALEESHGFSPAIARAAVHKVADSYGKKKSKDALSYLSDKAQQLSDYLRMQGSADVAVICRKLKVDEDALLNLIAEVNKNSEKIRIKGDPLVDKTLNMAKIKDSNKKKILTFIRDCKQRLQYKDADIRHLTRKDFREKWDKGVFAGKLTPEALQKGKWMGTYKTSGEPVTVVFKDAVGASDKQIKAAAQEAWDAGSEDAWQMLDDEGGDGVPMQKFLNGMKQQLTHCVTSRARMAADSEGFDSKDTSKVVAAATTIMNQNMGKFLKECRDYYE